MAAGLGLAGLGCSTDKTKEQIASMNQSIDEAVATKLGEKHGFLLDIKPGYETDPTRAVYNHIWLMGDATAIGGQVQAEIDELAELAPVGQSAGNQGAAGGGVAQHFGGPEFQHRVHGRYGGCDGAERGEL